MTKCFRVLGLLFLALFVSQYSFAGGPEEILEEMIRDVRTSEEEIAEHIEGNLEYFSDALEATISCPKWDVAGNLLLFVFDGDGKFHDDRLAIALQKARQDYVSLKKHDPSERTKRDRLLHSRSLLADNPAI